MNEVWIWQTAISPHMTALASELVDLGIDVTYVIEREPNEERKSLGWQFKNEVKFKVVNFTDIDFNDRSLCHVEHILQGIRGDNYIPCVIRNFNKKNIKFNVMMEMVDLSGIKGRLRFIYYYCLFKKHRKNLKKVFAIGSDTKKFLENISLKKDDVYEFAYFLESYSIPLELINRKESSEFRFIYVGQLIPRKNVSLLIKVILDIVESTDLDFKIDIIGDGELREELKRNIKSSSSSRINFCGLKTSEEVRFHISQSDCLVLPSKFDGWGAVVSESLISGTRVLCSDKCGSKAAVEHDPKSMVFREGNYTDLKRCLIEMVSSGIILEKERSRRTEWAKRLTAKHGAIYINEILFSKDKPNLPPWRV